MRKLISIIMILFSLLIINRENEDVFANIETITVNNFDFYENGVKIEYKIDKDKKDELLRLEKKLSENNTVNKDNQSLMINNNDYSIDIKVYENSTTNVEIVLLNNNKNLKVDDLKELVKDVLNDEVYGYREYSYIKVKKDNDMEDFKKLYSDLNINEIEILNIDNGKTIKGTLNDGSKINIGEINYDTGEYLIIGTPVIFKEY